MEKHTKIKYLVKILFTVFLFNCANQLPPGGGDVDTIPPEIIEIHPADGTINFSDDFFELTFSEYVDKRSAQSAIFISPAVEGETEYSWSGKSLEVSFEEPLKENTTYTIAVGTDVVDLNNKNNMAEAFNFAFSTGPEIDRFEITGKIYDKDPTGVMVFGYKKEDEDINPIVKKPDYISQVGKNGKFKLPGLSNGTYRVFAVRDDFRDLLYNIEEDYFGAPFLECELNKHDSVYTNLDFLLTKEDTSHPSVLSATMTDRSHILIEFSEFIDSTKINAGNFFIFDSTNNNRKNINFAFKGSAKDKHIFLSIADSLDEQSEYYLISEGITDIYQNISPVESTQLTVNSDPDTLAPMVNKIESNLKGMQLDFEHPEMIVFFNDGIDSNSAKSAMSFYDSKNRRINLTVQSIDDAAFKVLINSKLRPKSDYTIEINLSNLNDAAGNAGDSIYVQKLNTINDLDFSGALGIVDYKKNEHQIFVILENAAVENKLYIQSAAEDKTYNFERVIPGKYLVWAFIDKNGNETYDYGSISPFELSEEFAFYPDTLNLRARWPVADILIKFR